MINNCEVISEFFNKESGYMYITLRNLKNTHLIISNLYMNEI
jgi:hypothetical protein